MKTLFYNTFQKTRLDRIFSLLGKEWFEGKSILELGAAHGDIGSKLIELGSEVSFSDIREEYLEEIFQNHPNNVNIYKIDQNLPYNLNKTFDLVLHLGVLYHLVNWENDLKNALNHTNCLILETEVSPFPLENPNKIYHWRKTNDNPYISYNKQYKRIDEFNLIKNFKKLGVKYLRIDTPKMSTPYIYDAENDYVKFLYGWDKYSLPISLEHTKNNINYYISTRQMYLILK